MTRQDFQRIADTLRTSGEGPETIRRLADRFADTLAETNPRFDRERFLDACDPFEGNYGVAPAAGSGVFRR